MKIARLPIHPVWCPSTMGYRFGCGLGSMTPVFAPDRTRGRAVRD